MNNPAHEIPMETLDPKQLSAWLSLALSLACAAGYFLVSKESILVALGGSFLMLACLLFIKSNNSNAKGVGQ